MTSVCIHLVNYACLERIRGNIHVYILFVINAVLFFLKITLLLFTVDNVII